MAARTVASTLSRSPGWTRRKNAAPVPPKASSGMSWIRKHSGDQVTTSVGISQVQSPVSDASMRQPQPRLALMDGQLGRPPRRHVGRHPEQLDGPAVGVERHPAMFLEPADGPVRQLNPEPVGIHPVAG